MQQNSQDGQGVALWPPKDEDKTPGPPKPPAKGRTIGKSKPKTAKRPVKRAKAKKPGRPFADRLYFLLTGRAPRR